MSRELWEVHPGIEILFSLIKTNADHGCLEFARLEELALEAIKNRSRNNFEYLFHTFAKEVKQLGVEVDVFERAGQTERAAFNELASEAVVRVAQAYGTECVRRVVRILARASQVALKRDYQIERELMDVALRIAEPDVSVLGMMKHQHESGKDENDPHILVSYARLQAQGLIMRMQPNAEGRDAYSLTSFGIQFCRYCLD